MKDGIGEAVAVVVGRGCVEVAEGVWLGGRSVGGTGVPVGVRVRAGSGEEVAVSLAEMVGEEERVRVGEDVAASAVEMILVVGLMGVGDGFVVRGVTSSGEAHPIASTSTKMRGAAIPPTSSRRRRS